MKIKVKTKPISVNSAYPGIGRRFLSQEGKTYKEIIAWAGRKFDPTPGPLHIDLTFCFADNRRRDVDDYLKLSIDALTGIWYADDSQIQSLTAKKRKGDEYYVEIKATPL
jgi:Holliday junction resolvase RusA-like endonuclease